MAHKEHLLKNSDYARRQLVKFATALFRWRAEAKLSRNKLGKRVGCSENQIANIEKQQCYPSFPVYTALCREIGMKPVADFPAE
jgi:DNA-binding XRE family transcriptional regulator